MTTVCWSCLQVACDWSGRTDTCISGCDVLGLCSRGMTQMLRQHRIKSEDSGRERGSREGRCSAEEMTFELGLKG